MKGVLLRSIGFILSTIIAAGCANIVPPSGGPTDTAPPKLRSIAPADSQLNTRVKRIDMVFDEYVTLADVSTEVQISPLLRVPLTLTSLNKRVTIVIPDSLLLDETTYRISFGTAIRDIHEGTPYNSGGYTFSTGAYFDSLSVSGTVHDARTGLPDSSAFVMLYSAADNDSAIVRNKPMYVVRPDNAGNFRFDGLPPRPFRLYALRDNNGNLTFDGGAEWIAFADSVIRPASSKSEGIALRTFPESLGDTAVAAGRARKPVLGDRGAAAAAAGVTPGGYLVVADTGDARKRSQDIAKPLSILLGRRLSGMMNESRVFLAFDSAGATVEAPLRITRDSSQLAYYLNTDWREDAVYTLRLQKGFAVDSSGTDLLPGRYVFRTRRSEDYGKLSIRLPTKYYGRGFILQVMNATDTVYQKAVTDTLIHLPRVEPGVYSMRVIVDRNENGLWDAGDLFLRRQPELVVPYSQTINLKAGWEQQVDFEAPRERKLAN